MTRTLLFVTLAFFVNVSVLLGGGCDNDGCGALSVAEIRPQLALWPGNGPDCNADTEADILDYVCLLNIVPGLNPPVFDPIGAVPTVEVGATLAFTLSATDADGDVLVFSGLNLPANATVASGGGFSFTPAESQGGDYPVTFVVSDGLLTDRLDVTITVSGGEQKVTTAEDTAVDIPLAAAGGDPSEVYTLVSAPLHGQVAADATPDWLYRPESNYNGQDSFVYTVTLNGETGPENRVLITVTPVNDKPTVSNRALVTAIETGVSFTLTGADPENDPLSFTVLTNPQNGVLSGTAPSLTYTPNASFAGNDSLTYMANDGQVDSTPATITISVNVGSPVFDSHETLVNQETITLTGTAVGDVVEIATDQELFTVPIESGAFSAEIALAADMENAIFATTLVGGLRGAPAATVITRDGQAPEMTIQFPDAGATLTTATVDVAGTISDVLSGFNGLAVTVNGIPAVVDPGIGTNGSYFAEAVPLVADQINELVVVGMDTLGNTVTETVTVRRQSIPADAAFMEVVSGNAQEAQVDSQLVDPVVVKVTKANGSPFVNKVVTFTVTRSDGSLAGAAGLGKEDGRLTYQVRTDSNGLARAFWTLGVDAGCGNNRLKATSSGIAGSTFFCASAAAAPARQINLGTGSMQQGETGAPACQPLRAWVNDSCNGVAGTPVTFRVTRGGGLVNGLSEVTVTSSNTGHAGVNFTFGPEAGPNEVEADFEGNPGAPVIFMLEGLIRDAFTATQLVGTVVDNANRALGNAQCSLVVNGELVARVFTQPSGRFSFDDIPAGPVDLFIDGATANLLDGEALAEGSFPALHFMPVVVADTINQMPATVKLPPLNPDNAVRFDNTQDITLTSEDIDGLEMLIKAGSVRLADGSVPSPQNPAWFSVNQVHAEDVPMPMPDGAAPPFAWTLQPSGAKFDPPVKITYPNMSGLAPGALSFFLSFDHDTNQFEIVATGTVGEDGSTITTDPGRGLRVAGWGCNCPPYSVTGDCESCPPGTTGPDCEPCPPGTFGPNCEDCPPNSTEPECQDCGEFENECRTVELESEFATASQRITEAMEQLSEGIPGLELGNASISGRIFAHECPICCNDQELFPGRRTLGGSITGSFQITASPPMLPNFEIEYSRSTWCGRVELGLNVVLTPSIEITPSLTLTAQGIQNLCTGENCFEISGSTSIGLRLIAEANLGVTTIICGAGFEVEIGARAEAWTTAHASVTWNSCEGTTVDGCIDPIDSMITVTIPIFDPIEFGPYRFYDGNCG